MQDPACGKIYIKRMRDDFTVIRRFSPLHPTLPTSELLLKPQKIATILVSLRMNFDGIKVKPRRQSAILHATGPSNLGHSIRDQLASPKSVQATSTCVLSHPTQTFPVASVKSVDGAETVSVILREIPE